MITSITNSCRRSKSPAELSIDKLIDMTHSNQRASEEDEKAEDSEELCWYDELALVSPSPQSKDTPAFAIEEDSSANSQLPMVLQDKLLSHFQEERVALQLQISKLQEEISGSQATFDKYRERARASLLKSASEQQQTEAKLKQCQELLHVSS